jgi:hypothetical protein
MQSDSIGVERRRLPFTLIENIVLEDQALGPADILVYLAIAKYADGEGACWPSMATLAKLARCARCTVAKSIAHLEVLGYLRRTPRFRPDGGVTSNAYQLMPLEAKRYPPVAQEDPPPLPQRQPPVAQEDTNYIHLELDPSKESAPRPAETPQASPEPVREIAAVSLSVLLEQIKQEAQACGAPPCFIAGGWAIGIQALVADGVSHEEILKAFTACLETAPERVTFFPKDFLKWRKVSRTRVIRDQREDQRSKDRQARECDRAREREQALRDREDPYWQEQVEAAIAQLPWRRVQA